jgi:predicted ATPase/class 3 adenylate cyclase
MLFTDIEESTRRALELAAEWPDALKAHHTIVRRAIELHNGYVDGTEGDAFFACFENPRDAIDAAVDAQRALASAEGPNGRWGLKVRMGLHTGWIERRDVGYVGVEVHRAARVGAVANGGQVLLTRASQSLLGPDVPVEFLGEHRLKDFPNPEPLFHLVVDGVGAEEFAAPRTPIARPTNLREDLRSLVGRGQELSRLLGLLRSDARIVTVVGAGGAGKTRLALTAARQMLDELPGGAFVVPLASLRDPEAVPGAVARALNLARGDSDPTALIAAWAAGRPTLVVLDNFEQLLPGAEVVARLASAIADLRLLTTSQTPLRVGGEVVMKLGPLASDAAVELYVERAQAAVPTFAPAAADRRMIAEVCRRVGGLPLAIELAAARATVLDTAELLARLEQSSELLRVGRRDAPERQRSLRATFEWTYALLHPEQRVLFRRLGVFSGPVSLEVIEAVCEVSGDEQLVSSLDALDELVSFSLIGREERAGHEIRFTAPQALRNFARGELQAAGEEQTFRHRHSEHLAMVASEVQVWFSADPAARARVLALDAEIGPALEWSSRHDFPLYRQIVAGLALGLVLHRGQIRDALEHTSRARAGSGAPDDELDAWLGYCTAWALLASGKVAEASREIEPVIEFYRQRANALRLGLALNMAAWTPPGGDFKRGVALARESLELLRSTGVPALANRGLVVLISNLIQLGALAEGEQLLTEAEESVTDPESELANRIATLRGDVGLSLGDGVAALPHLARSLELAARRGDGLQESNDAKCITHALALSGHLEDALEAAGAAAAIADDRGHMIAFGDVEAAIDSASAAVGPDSARLFARGRSLAPSERVPRLLALAKAAARREGSRAPISRSPAAVERGSDAV